MSDIWTAIFVMSCFAALAAMIAARYLSTQKGQWVMLWLAVSMLATILFLLNLTGQLAWARIVPHSAAIIYTNLAAIFAGLGAGWGWRLPHTPTWRRAILASGLALASLAVICWPLLSLALRPPPKGESIWKGPVALQTSWATCSPAAAATLLSAEGIYVSERDMIPLCLTDDAGTPTLGLYRGIKLIAMQHGRHVQVVDRRLEKLLDDNEWPVLMAVRLPLGVEDPRFADEWGWIPGMGHSVVAFGRLPDGGLLVGDPAVGLELWSAAKLELLWQGNGLRVR